MDIFLSYPSSEKKLAERLRDELSRQGANVWTDSGGSDWQQQIEAATRSAEDILVLLGPKQADDPAQRYTWQAALEAVWATPSKRLVPVLLPGAKLPSFVYSGSSEGKVEAIQIKNPKHLAGTVQTILKVLQDRPVEPPILREAGPLHTNASSVVQPIQRPDDDSPDAYSFTAVADRESVRSRLSEIRQFAENLKP